MVEYHHCSHRFHDGDGTGDYTRVVTAVCLEGGGLTFHIDGGLFLKNRGDGFEGHPEINVLSVAHTALDTAAVVGGCANLAFLVDKHVIEFTALPGGTGKAFAILKAFHGIDAEHGASERCVQFSKLWFSDTGRTTCHHAGDDAADGVSLAFYLSDEGSHLLRYVRIGTPNGIEFCVPQVVEPVVVVKGNVTYLRGVGTHADTHLLEHQFCECSSYASANGCSRRCAAASAMVTYTILLLVGIVGMGGSKQSSQALIVL